MTSREPPAVLVAGMHRSGTSMVGGMLASLGIDMGRRLLPADVHNERGYFEDVDIVTMHGELFAELLPEGAAGHVDWGWCEQHELDEARLAEFGARARTLAAERAGGGVAWGFKDPRTTLTLDVWEACLDQPRYVLVYRFPWEVADSMQRGGAPVFLTNPSYGHRIWTHYNERLIRFYERHRDRCLLVSSNALPGQLEDFRQLLTGKLGLDLASTDLSEAFDPALFQSQADDKRADLMAAAYPECVRLLGALDELADIPARGLWRSEQPTRTSVCGPADAADVAVSIVVPVYDDGVYLLDALASVEQWADASHELIVVDDGSTDPETLRILDAIRARGTTVLRQVNGGLSSARNAGIERARGRYVLPLDADNRLRPGFLELAVAALDQAPDVGVIYGDRQLFGARSGVYRQPAFDLRKLLGGNDIDACALYRRALWEDVGGYDTEMICLEDWEFWLHAGRRGWQFRHVPQEAFDYRVRGNSLFSTIHDPAVRRHVFARLLERHGQLLHEHVPWPLRIVSRMATPFLSERSADALASFERRLFWRTLWSLVGPGGFIASDRRR